MSPNKDETGLPKDLWSDDRIGMIKHFLKLEPWYTKVQASALQTFADVFVDIVYSYINFENNITSCCYINIKSRTIVENKQNYIKN